MNINHLYDEMKFVRTIIIVGLNNVEKWRWMSISGHREMKHFIVSTRFLGQPEGVSNVFRLILTIFTGVNTNLGGWEAPEGVKPSNPQPPDKSSTVYRAAEIIVRNLETKLFNQVLIGDESLLNILMNIPGPPPTFVFLSCYCRRRSWPPVVYSGCWSWDRWSYSSILFILQIVIESQFLQHLLGAFLHGVVELVVQLIQRVQR